MRPEKLSLIGELRDQLDRASFVILADYQGLTVEKITKLRDVLASHRGRMHVVKNSLLTVLGRENGWDLSGLIGPTAVIVGDGDVAQVVKAIKKFAVENELPRVKAGRLGKTPLGADEVKALADLPSREALIAQIVGLIAAPLTQLVGVMNQKVCSLLYVLKAIEETKANKAA